MVSSRAEPNPLPSSFKSTLRSTAPGSVIVLPALSPTSTSRVGWRRAGLERLRQSLEKQFSGPTPQIVDDDIDPFAPRRKSFAHRLFRLAKRDNRSPHLPGDRIPHCAPLPITRFAPKCRAAWIASCPGHARCAQDHDRLASSHSARSFIETQADIPGLAMAAACTSSIPSGKRKTHRSLVQRNARPWCPTVARGSKVNAGFRPGAYRRHRGRRPSEPPGRRVVRSARNRLHNRVQSGGANVDEDLVIARNRICKLLILGAWPKIWTTAACMTDPP